MQQKQDSASEWNSCNVECWWCGNVLKASSLSRHLADVHDIYQQAVVAEELLEDHTSSAVSVSGLYWVATRWLDDAATLPRRPSNGPR
jgi:hypothetical protein